MADYEATVSSSWTREQTFDYLADFRHVAEWDPSMRSADLLDGEPGSVGAHYRLVMGVVGREIKLTYEATEMDRPRRFVMRCDNDAMTSIDTVTVADDATVTYRAEIEMKGLTRIVDPIIQVGLTRASDNAKESLAAMLGS
jgi:hypothetical protein